MREYVPTGVGTGLGPCPGKFSVPESRIPFRVHGTLPDSRVPQIYDSDFDFSVPDRSGFPKTEITIDPEFFTNEEEGTLF